jgi:hypothetical protein
MLSDVLLVNPTLFPWIATRRAWRLRTKPGANVILGADQGHCSWGSVDYRTCVYQQYKAIVRGGTVVQAKTIITNV